MKLAVGLVSAALAAAVSQADASPVVTLIDPIFGGHEQVTTGPSVDFTGSNINLSDSSSSVSVSVDLGVPSLKVSGSTSSQGVSVGEASVEFGFEIVGPASPSAVSVIVNANGNASGTGTFSNLQSTYQIYSAVNSAGGLLNQSIPGNGSGGSWTLNQALSLSINTEYYASMSVQGVSETNAGGSGSYTAFIDPMFTIDPNTLNANQYSFLFSPGIGNGGETPLPGALVLFGSGLVGFGAFVRRRKKTSVVALAAA